MSNPSQLFLLADHIKLSLLERQRAASLNLEPNASQDSNISRSLESFREGIESLSSRSSDTDSLTQLRTQYDDLYRQFHGSSSPSSTVTSPNDPSLQSDFARAQTRTSADGRPQPQTKNSSLRVKDSMSASNKNVRFRDNPSQESLDSANEANRASLFPGRYTDEPDDGTATPDPTTDMSNQQIHTYHQQVMQEQDDQLDTLGESIGRQRQLAMQVGDELEGQIGLLDEVDRGVDRHQGRLDGAKRRLKTVGEKARQNWGMTTIIILIVILVFLIAILK